MSTPPFLDVWTINKRKRFYLFESQKLIFDGENICSVKLDKKTSHPFLNIEYDDQGNLNVLTKDVIKMPIYLAGSRQKNIKIKMPTFFKFVGHEIFVDNIKNYDGDFWFTGYLSNSVKDSLACSRHTGTVFLIGDTGTGKELFAKNLHYNSARRHQPFVAVNCASLDFMTAEKELFGNVKGAFTDGSKASRGIFVNAGAGTIFLDNIENLPMNVQPMLLRSLELYEVKASGSDKTKKHKARIMVSSSMAPKELLYKGLIRKDLYYRIEETCVYLSELREMKNEIKNFVSFYVGGDFCLEQGVLAVLEGYDWPGNIRELKNAIERAKILALKDGVIKKSYFDMKNRFDFKSERIKNPYLIYPLENQERNFISDTLNKNKWNIVDTALELNVCRVTLQAKIESYGLKDHH